MKLTLTKVRKVRGHDDSLPFDAILLADGKPVAELFDDGWGGEVQIHWLPDGRENNEVWNAIMELGRNRHLKEHPEEGLEKANEYARLYGLSELAGMASDALMLKDMVRLAKKNVLFTIPEMGTGEYKTVKVLYDPKVRDWIIKKYPNAMILNDFIDDPAKIKQALKLVD
jgi:hypothetical protein